MRRAASSGLGTLVGFAVWLAAGAAAGAALDATVTSVQGEAHIDRDAMKQGARVEGGAPIVTSPDARGSVLVGADAVVQFCGDTSLQLREDAGATVVAVSEGTAKTRTGPRASDRPLEIHTPAAVAVIHGTEVSTTIDPLTGATTFAVDEGVVEIRPNGGAPVMLRAGESVTVPQGGPAGAVERIRPDRLADLLDCLEDTLFHAASVERSREAREVKLVEVLVDQDRPDFLPPVSAEPTIFETLPDPTPDAETNVCELDPSSCDPEIAVQASVASGGGEPPIVEPPEPPIPPCGPGPPGEHCL
jgi:hypothetical protein